MLNLERRYQQPADVPKLIPPAPIKPSFRGAELPLSGGELAAVELVNQRAASAALGLAKRLAP